MKGTKINLKQMQMDSVSPATRLLEKRRLMYEVQEAFERQKEEERRREEKFKKTEEELRQRDLKIQEELIKFNKILQENESKRQRVIAKGEEERKAVKEKKRQKELLDQELRQQDARASRLEKQMNAMKIYEEFLEQVKERNPEEFTDINDILNLHTKLTTANEDLKHKQKMLEEENAAMRQELDRAEKQRNDLTLQLNIEITDTTKKHEEMDQKRQGLANEVESRRGKATSQTLQLGQIFMVIDNLYTKCVSYPGLLINHSYPYKAELNRPSETSQEKLILAKIKLKIIKDYLHDFRDIHDKIPREIIVRAEEQRANKLKPVAPQTSA